MERALSEIVRWATRAETVHRLAGGAALSRTDMWLLRQVGLRGPLRMSALADLLQVDRSTMTTQVRRLTDAGLVERGSDAADARAVTVAVTGEGRRTLEHASAQTQELCERLVADWPDADRSDFARLLHRFADGIDRAVSLRDGDPGSR